MERKSKRHTKQKTGRIQSSLQNETLVLPRRGDEISRSETRRVGRLSRLNKEAPASRMLNIIWCGKEEQVHEELSSFPDSSELKRQNDPPLDDSKTQKNRRDRRCRGRDIASVILNRRATQNNRSKHIPSDHASKRRRATRKRAAGSVASAVRVLSSPVDEQKNPHRHKINNFSLDEARIRPELHHPPQDGNRQRRTYFQGRG